MSFTTRYYQHTLTHRPRSLGPTSGETTSHHGKKSHSPLSEQYIRDIRPTQEPQTTTLTSTGSVPLTAATI
jgi:hypothetical protein